MVAPHWDMNMQLQPQMVGFKGNSFIFGTSLFHNMYAFVTGFSE